MSKDLQAIPYTGHSPSNSVPGDTPRVKDLGENGSSLAKLLTAFNAAELGEGNLDAGANLLAAMAITLGNLARPGSGIRTPSGRVIPVGSNILITGPALSRLVIDELVIPVGHCQDNLLAQLTRLLQDDAAERAKTTPRQWVLSNRHRVNRGQQALFQIMTSDPDTPPPTQSFEEMWETAAAEPPAYRFEDLVQRPRAFIAAHTKRDLENRLPAAHLGEALVAIGLTRAADTANLGDLCLPLINGLFPGGPFGELVRGRLLVTDHGSVLREVAAAPDERNGWLSRLVWLVEGSAGPEAPFSGVNGDHPITSPNPNGMFMAATLAVYAKRFNIHGPKPQIYCIDLSETQVCWAAFLKKMEDRIPGISGTARSLLATLAFGFAALEKARNYECLEVPLQGIMALGQWIIGRMGNARTMMLHAGEAARRRSQIERVYGKLEQGPTEVRNIYRNLNALSADECRECLRWMEQSGISRCIGDRWELVEGARLNFRDGNAPFLDV